MLAMVVSRPSRRVAPASLLALTLLAWPVEALAGQLSLTWDDNSGDELGFSVERSTGTTGAFTKIAVTGPGVPVYTDVGLADGTTYCYRVQAFNASADSDYSNVACGIAAQVAGLAVVKMGAGSGTVISAPSGIICGASCSGTFPSGTRVTLTPSADTGSVFSGWSGGGCSGTDPCIVTLISTTTVIATFAPRQTYSLTLALNKESYTTGETFSATVTEANSGDAPISVDKYFGVLLPASASSLVPCPGADGIVFLFPEVRLTCLSSPATFRPYKQNVLLPAGFLVTTPRFFDFVWPPAPSGTYVFFIAYTRTGTLEVIAAGTSSASFTP